VGNLISKTRIILVGCGPHAKRVYLPALRQLQHIELALIIDLESQEHSVRAAVKDSPNIELWFIKPFSAGIPVDLAQRISAFVFEQGVTGVIIATEPLVHKAYAECALQNELSILIDKPITTQADAVSNMTSAEGILDDYMFLFEKYSKLQLKKETLFMVNSQRRFHKGFQFVQDKIREIAKITNCPVTFVQAYHCDGQWRLPSEIVSQEYHPYCFGYGKVSHSGYHIFDTVYQFYKAAEVHAKSADTMEIVSSFIQPNGFLTQLTETDYQKLFGEKYNAVNQWSDKQLKQINSDFGEIDASAIITLKKNEVAIANLNINLLHNGFAGRTWVQPGKDLYKGNGRIKHESYHIQQGPFQNIQIHAYQANDKHDEDRGLEGNLGGKNHFDIYVFRNPMVADSSNQPQVYKLNEIMEEADVAPESMVTMEWVKFKVVEEFADYLTGRRDKASIQSQIEDHLVPVQMMSGIYRSHILRQNNQPNVVKSAFGMEEPVSSMDTTYPS
jgi:predicted dehydrogenase